MRSTPSPMRSPPKPCTRSSRGNPENALATLERIAKGEEPPALTVTQSPTPGVRLTHRVAVVLPANATAPGWPVVRTPRAAAEPLLDAWCGLMLGPADAVTLDRSTMPVVRCRCRCRRWGSPLSTWCWRAATAAAS